MRITAVLPIVFALAACGSNGNSGQDASTACDPPKVADFVSVPAGAITDMNLNGIVFTREAGSVEIFRDGNVSVIVLWDGLVTIDPPCEATEVEIVLDDSEVSVAARGLSTPAGAGGQIFELESTSANKEPEVLPYYRWVIPLPNDFRRLQLDTRGHIDPSNTGLIKSITFR